MGKFIDIVNLEIRTLRRFISLSFILGIMLLIVRLNEIVFTSYYYNYPPGSFVTLLSGIKYDIIIYLRISAILMLPYLLLGLFSQKVARWFFILISVLLILGDILLLKYFATALVPLGADLFAYSFSEIRETIQTSGSVSIWPFIFMALFLIYVVMVFKKHVYVKLKPWMLALISLLMFASLLPLKVYSPQPSNFTNEFSMFAATNKLNFFGESVLKRYVFNEKAENQNYTFKPVDTQKEGSFYYVDEEYPLLHTETTPDVLGKYFDLGETSPNIVFIIVESLGRAYSGEGAYLGSFTPFLDSLMGESLYWENCLSTSGRTFEVLPSTLASVPFGKRGFNDLEENMPDHISLLSLLKKEAGYKSSFFYGGEAHFDNMDLFLKRQGIDHIVDNGKFGEQYKRMPASASGFSWGYGDRETFKRYIDEKKTEDSIPGLDVILTLSMHTPFIVEDQDFYITKFEQRLEELDLSEATVAFNKNYENQFSTVLYFDDALKYFLSEMKKMPSFDSTIFVITGDHRMPEIPISTQLDRFHVPLVIYSPMIKSPTKFSAIVTHFDITPSLIALLDGNGTISRPDVASWIGYGLDDEEDFRNLRAYPLMRNKNEILDFIDGERMLANGVLYQIFENMDIEPVDESYIENDLKAQLNNFILQNNYVTEKNKLIPDSLYKYTFH